MGVTGRLRFWQDGRRRGYVINILNVADGSFHKVSRKDALLTIHIKVTFSYLKLDYSQKGTTTSQQNYMTIIFFNRN